MINKTIGILEKSGQCEALFMQHQLRAAAYRKDQHYDYLVIVASDYQRSDYPMLMNAVLDADEVLVSDRRVYRSRWPQGIKTCCASGDFYIDHIIETARDISCDFYAHHGIVGHCVMPKERYEIPLYVPLLAVAYLEGEQLSFMCLGMRNSCETVNYP